MIEKFLIVGLGNPEPKFNLTRHNFGFIVLDKISKQKNYQFSVSKKFKSSYSKVGKNIYLLKPETYMNLSGEAVYEISKYFEIKSTNTVVIHDDIDIDFGKIRIRRGGSSGGHKGLDSIIKKIGENFIRIRLGIRNNNLSNLSAETYVLSKFSKEEQKKLDPITNKCIEVLDEIILKGNIENKTIN